MSLEYDNKFDEMKKYIPFLESMIKRLESTSTSATNPRQAQLDKIRSLRDLLLDRKKRMKMENLLKCEQVLINLYAKVEQRDTLPGITPFLPPAESSDDKEKPDLNSARNKLKTVAANIKNHNEESGAFEIAGANETEVICTPGSKEPALFQRRPNKASRSPSRNIPVDIIDLDDNIKKESPQKVVPKRNYTRVLVSPDPSPRRWTSSEDPTSDKPLFIRRSPRKSPKRHSPAYSKKEKIKSSKDKSKRRDLNITLNVPEESLSSLNTEDILSRIIKCHDNDVEIDTLRDLRTQILEELKRTGASEDISDLILKSYKSSKKRTKKKTDEVEEGELSDSESEAIESVYGSLVLVDKDKNNASHSKISNDKEKQARKIQICLVMNSVNNSETVDTQKPNELKDFEMFDDDVQCIEVPESKDKKIETQNKAKQSVNQKSKGQEVIMIDDEDDANKDTSPKTKITETITTSTFEAENKDSDSSYIDISSSDTDTTSLVEKSNEKDTSPFRANFYKPLNDQESIKEQNKDNDTIPTQKAPEIHLSENNISSAKNISDEQTISDEKISTQVVQNEDSKKKECTNVTTSSGKKQSNEASQNQTEVEIPLLNTESPAPPPAKKDVLSEIDILQALKNEILSDSISIPGSDVSTPLLHQPKVTKVSNAQAIVTKKRISIEKYKEKAVSASKSSLFLNDPMASMAMGQNAKKNSLKLTEQECERFNFPAKLALDSSEEEDDGKTDFSVDDIYANLAPKSPENTEECNPSAAAPIIIPADPVKPSVVSAASDVDMRTVMPLTSPNAPRPVPLPIMTLPPLLNTSDPSKMESKRPPLIDPRVRRELNTPLSKNSPSHAISTPRHTVGMPNMTPNMTANCRSFEMTPSHQSFDFDENSGRKHVYAPIPNIDGRDREKSMNRDSHMPQWEANSERVSDDRNHSRRESGRWDDRDRRDGKDYNRDNRDHQKSRYDDKYQRSDRYSEYRDNRMECPRTPVHPFGRSDSSTTANPSFGRHDAPMNTYSRSECPTTPIHPFSRNDCPTTPSHPFGRSEIPTTPIHPFGRSDCPQTPSHPFGRTDCPQTPNHPFGRSDCPQTPSHPFGRSDTPMTPSHPFGRSEPLLKTPGHSFGRSDAPMTPSHPFGRSEAPITPSHPFGRTDAPMTPSHPFGRSDAPRTPSHPFGRAPMTPSHPFGRSDYSQSSKLVKDPRLNRSSDYESRKYNDERDQDYYKDRRMSDRSYNTESYQRHDRGQSVGRNDRSNYDQDRHRNYRERTPGRESSVGRSLSKDYDRDRYSRDCDVARSRDYNRESENTHYNEGGQRRGYQGAQSVGRSGQVEDRFSHSDSRQPKDNTLSVKPQSGKAFTIDTSVNATFQELLKEKGLQILDYSSSMDSRRKRAASVGRSLTRESSMGRNFRESSVGRSLTRELNVGRNFRESSVGRTLPRPQQVDTNDTSGYKNMVNFVRARSMGRDLNVAQKSFKEIKADFESYRANYKSNEKSKNISNKGNDVSFRGKKVAKETPRNNKAFTNTKKAAYSPRKNNRDPRMRRDQQADNKYKKNRYEDKRNTYGIVYSNDNIAKGAILGSGYGVKNYKIPKIKRPVEEIKAEEEVRVSNASEKKDQIDKRKLPGNKISTENRNQDVSSKSKPDVKKKVVKKSDLNEKKQETKMQSKEITDDSEKKRVTKSNKKPDVVEAKSLQDEIIVKTKKLKKAIIDSDSDTETIDKSKEIVENNKPSELQGNDKKEEEDLLNSSFGLDDLMFPENITSDPVMANINALIADLDNDLSTNKLDDNTDFSKDFDTIFENINNPEREEEESFKDISEVIRNDSKNPCIENDSVQKNPKESNEKIELDLKQDKQQEDTATKQNNNHADSGSTVNSKPLERNEMQENRDKDNVEAIVSTTENPTEPLKKPEELSHDPCSTPDSTINTNEITQNTSQDGFPDSTNTKNETDVTSTHDQTEKDTANSFNKDVTPADSIGNLLSILQNKSKLKELLGMLDGQSSESEKIKKKLEKLSEIVSDDEDSNDTSNVETVEKVGENETEVSTDMTKADNSIETDKVDKSVEIKESIEDLNQHDEESNDAPISKPKSTKSRKVSLKRSKKGKCKVVRKTEPELEKRMTRSEAAILRVEKPKKPSRELKQLHESIKEMFSNDDNILNASGIRMCRLAKMIDEKNPSQEEMSNIPVSDPKPVVVLEKFKDTEIIEDAIKIKKKPGPKPKSKNLEESSNKTKDTKSLTPPKYKPGPKSKTKIIQEDSDPYSFDDSVSEATTTEQTSAQNSSDSESESLSSEKSFGSSEVLAELKKKPKRRRRPKWSSGVIKPNKKRKKLESKQVEVQKEVEKEVLKKPIAIPDMNCFTDKTYCFLKNVHTYSCRLCSFNGPEIVKHYKTEHPHTEIPLSRMSAVVAREAIEQCEDINFHAISQMHTDRYVCRFCFEEFGTKRNVLEEFFWHVVSMHTGEYKRLCSECINVTRCPFNLDIPPPPKDKKGQLIGYICGKCNFTQISLENLKTHVIVRHNDEQTAVYTINLALMSKKTMKALMKNCEAAEQPRVLRSTRSSQSLAETSDGSDTTENTEHLSETEPIKTEPPTKRNESSDVPVYSKLTFESDDNVLDTVKEERLDNDDESPSQTSQIGPEFDNEPDKLSHTTLDQHSTSNDILDYPHFKVCYTSNGNKEYVCCINGEDNHYKTALLISMKKHVQTKHSEVWDGYCSICKVIVMPQGSHKFKDCLQHLLDKHMDNFPIFSPTETPDNVPEKESVPDPIEAPKSTYINVRPLSELISKDICSTDNAETLPKIQSVVSLGDTEEIAQPAPSKSPQIQSTPDVNSLFKTPVAKPVPQPVYKYEEVQAEVMSKKHRVVLDAMMPREKLVQIFKCAGRYCSFTTDSAEAAVLHASTHQRIGGENALICAYCDFDCKANVIDLVMHVFKAHGSCQYVCPYCFYRAVASQLVLSHINRIHGETIRDDEKVVLQTTAVTPVTENKFDVLPREVAAPHYICPYVETCKFKTYTQGKFVDHLTKHEPPYTCHECSEIVQSSIELVHHMRKHGLKLYQCTWCIDGGDNEADFLVHSSTKHPDKEPQAYMRVITHNIKDGAARVMVLPLCKLNKPSVDTQMITATNAPEDPVKEAERANGFERIIIAMPAVVSAVTAGGTPSLLVAPLPQRSPTIVSQSITPSNSSSTPSTSVPITTPTVTNSPSLADLLQNKPQISETTKILGQGQDVSLTPIIKTEPSDEPQVTDKVKSDIICLDSDEEDSRDSSDSSQNVIDLSRDESAITVNSEELIKMAPHQLFKCKCSMVCKNLGGFKKHIHSCLGKTSDFQCAHCSFVTHDSECFFRHYMMDHTISDRAPYHCGICDLQDKSIGVIKYHAKRYHGCTSLTVTSKFKNGKMFHYVVSGSSKTKHMPKRKLSSGSIPESPPKRTRYGPQDLDKLPQKPILDELTYCSECKFSTKVRLNLVRHFQQHAEAQSVPVTAPVNPVPHLETNEKHFDKMTNLASSSLMITKPDKPAPTVTLHIPPEAASRYPKYVPDRQRHTCGAKGCSYISVDEAMLKCHWETLHSGSNDFHCVHCPPYQHLDTSKPLTASRIIAHLKMHDVCLYACSSCSYYHHKRLVVEKHLVEVHKGSGQVTVVREDSSNQSSGLPQPTNAAPTMDLKPWKCGLCSFKSMLRPEVIEHCSKTHGAKMQFKCPACPFRTSTIENVTKHKTNSHPGNTEDVFYYYYREGSIPDDPDGTPRWAKQMQKMGVTEPEVKKETSDNSIPNVTTAVLPPAPRVNLEIVKREVIDPELEESPEELCKRFGEICEPNGLKYKCPLCKLVNEDSRDAMQSHLYEELKYRKWGCSICSYKAFHKNGLKDHMFEEHRIQRGEPIELPEDSQVEKWVAKVLDHQSAAIETNKMNFAKQKIIMERQTTSKTIVNTSKEVPATPLNEKQLEEAIKQFGQLGAPDNTNFCCPKCDYRVTDEGAMKDHLETELNKIRWRCSTCGAHSQNYHEAQLHTKTCKTHSGPPPRPVEAIRDPSMRAAWLAAVIRTQKRAIEQTEDLIPVEEASNSHENSLLVIRYEEDIPTPEEEMLSNRKRPLPTTSASPDSDDERLVIDEPTGDDMPKKISLRSCPHCDFVTKYASTIDDHILRHYDLKPLTCHYCQFTFYKTAIKNHWQSCHPGLPERYTRTKLPSGPPTVTELLRKGRRTSNVETPKKEEIKKDDGPKLICLTCEKSVSESETTSHVHDKKPYFGKRGEVVVKCCICLSLLPNVNAMQEHFNQMHPTAQINYAYFKLHHDTRVIHQCGHCNKRFKFLGDLKSHHNLTHLSLKLSYTNVPYTLGVYDFESEANEVSKKKSEVLTYHTESSSIKCVARKSTTKLPNQTVAKKSTTKLPLTVESESDSETEYSFYGTKPTTPEELENVTALMPFCNKMRSFTMKQLNELLDINPVVVVRDYNVSKL